MREAKERFPNDDLSDAAIVCETCLEAILKKLGGDVS